LEAGWAVGAGKLTIVYVPGLREPDLMVKMADVITNSFDEVRLALRKFEKTGWKANELFGRVSEEV
jgi:hypothetical protein